MYGQTCKTHQFIFLHNCLLKGNCFWFSIQIVCSNRGVTGFAKITNKGISALLRLLIPTNSSMASNNTTSGKTAVNDVSDTGWQTPYGKATKRRREESPRMQRSKRQADVTTLENRNMFSELSTDEDDDNNNDQQQNTNNINEPKPPPIIIPNVSNIKLMTTKLLSIISKDDFSYKSLRDGQIRLMIKSIDSYRKVVKYLDEKNINYHTYQVKQERAYRVVIKGVHFSTPVDDLKIEIESYGHEVRNIINAKSRINKQPLSMFFVDLEPKANNKDVYNIRAIDNVIVNVETPKKVEDLVQCHRCQMFGHTKSFCRNPFRCVKCGLSHSTLECTKSKEMPPQCVHCLEHHTASYRGCKIYKELVMKRKNNQSNFRTQRQSYAFNSNNPHVDSNQNHFSYAEAVRHNPTQQSADPFKNIENLLQKQIELTNSLINMMSMVLSKLCK